MNVYDFFNKKTSHEKITMVTCYDYTSACILNQTTIDCLLIGDSVAMTMHGYENTISATVEMMAYHTSAVRRGAPNKFIVSDMPFLSYRKSLSRNVSAAQMLMQAGANSIKIECAAGNTRLIRHLVDSGIPVVGHLGLTPQSIHTLGGYRVQGKTKESSEQIEHDAFALQEAGCFAIVLECIASDAALKITNQLSIPTIGIGAGPNTDGQVLVFQDLLGLNINFKPKFVKTFLNGQKAFTEGIEKYIEAVKKGEFPQAEHSY